MPLNQRAFSLVELSIVLVVLGLLVGGILTGRALVHASELRAVTTEFARYRTAINAFRDRYFAAPGDMTNATLVWGKDNAACSGHTGTATTPGTCNGNGDNIIAGASAPNGTGEYFQFWKQLALAGLIEGNYTGLSGPAATNREIVIGSNAPASRLPNAGYSIYYQNVTAGHPDRWLLSNGTNIDFGALDIVYGGGYETDGYILTPEDAWNIDSKMDDGIPSQGKLYSYKSGINPNCATTTVDATAAYNLSYTGVACSFQLAILR